jgi:predicted CXXCH cytochrome family protein
MKKIKFLPFVVGILMFGTVMLMTVSLAQAAPPLQEEEPHNDASVNNCGECHLDIAESWSHSPHAHAYDDPYFQEKWTGLGKPGECLLCHTTEYVASTGEYAEEGVYCEACHGRVSGEHPPEIVTIRADTEYCGSCHTTTLSEWRSTAHHPSDVGCMDCHNPHSQEALFENPDDMCINCHQEDMERYLEDLHVQKDIGCVDCHALVIPPEEVPDDGIVPTGHAFNITPATCVACHTDALHAGFSLPGFENGANGTMQTEGMQEPESESETPATEAEVLTPEQRIEALETALASRNFTTLFQGGVVGIVLGGSTAWIVARNIRNLPVRDEEKEGIDDEENQEE